MSLSLTTVAPKFRSNLPLPVVNSLCFADLSGTELGASLPPFPGRVSSSTRSKVDVEFDDGSVVTLHPLRVLPFHSPSIPSSPTLANGTPLSTFESPPSDPSLFSYVYRYAAPGWSPAHREYYSWQSAMSSSAEDYLRGRTSEEELRATLRIRTFEKKMRKMEELLRRYGSRPALGLGVGRGLGGGVDLEVEIVPVDVVEEVNTAKEKDANDPSSSVANANFDANAPGKTSKKRSAAAADDYDNDAVATSGVTMNITNTEVDIEDASQDDDIWEFACHLYSNPPCSTPNCSRSGVSSWYVVDSSPRRTWTCCHKCQEDYFEGLPDEVPARLTIAPSTSTPASPQNYSLNFRGITPHSYTDHPSRSTWSCSNCCYSNLKTAYICGECGAPSVVNKPQLGVGDRVMAGEVVDLISDSEDEDEVSQRSYSIYAISLAVLSVAFQMSSHRRPHIAHF